MQFTITLLTVALTLAQSASAAVGCYSSGVWAARSDGYTRARTACSSIAGSIPGGGAYAICVNGNSGIRWNFRVVNTDDTAWNMSYDDCTNSMIEIISACGGQNDDTRGGNNSVNIGGITWTFTADPNSGSC